MKSLATHRTLVASYLTALAGANPPSKPKQRNMVKAQVLQLLSARRKMGSPPPQG